MKQKKKNQYLQKQINFNRFGIGLNKKESVFKKVGVNTRIKINNIKDIKINTINKTNYIKSIKKLKKKVKAHISFYIRLRNIRGIRHKQFKPVRGQRTKTNAKTRRKKRKKKYKAPIRKSKKK